MNMSNLNNEILVSEHKHEYNHAYGIDLSLLMDQYQMTKQDKTCHLCCLFALNCLHRFQSLNYSNIQQCRNEKNYNAILSSIDIWKVNSNQTICSPFNDIPKCFQNNFSSIHKQILSRTNVESEQHLLYPIKQTISSHRSYESLLHRLPTPPKTAISQQSSIDSNVIELIKLIDDDDNDHRNSISSVSSSLSFDINYSQSKKQKLSEKLSTNEHQTVLIDSKYNQANYSSSKSKRTNEYSQITISQFIKDIKTNIETSIDYPKSPLKLTRRSEQNYRELNFKKSSSISPINKTEIKSSAFPTVPKCLNEYVHKNFNSLLTQNNTFNLNPFDSSLFQWEIFNKNQHENHMCRKKSSLCIDKHECSIKSFINFIEVQRQYVPLEYSSWNISFSNYHPLNFSFKKINSNENLTIKKNPYGRTGLCGHSLFDNYGPNRYIISLIITEKNNQQLILLYKNKHDRWELPKIKKLKKKIHYHTLDIAYLDHPLNTDDTWIELEIILIKKYTNKYIHHKKTWFPMKYLHKLNSIEHFDFDLIQFYT